MDANELNELATRLAEKHAASPYFEHIEAFYEALQRVANDTAIRTWEEAIGVADKFSLVDGEVSWLEERGYNRTREGIVEGLVAAKAVALKGEKK